MSTYSKLNRPIHVEEYNSRWPFLFEQEKSRITATLGNRVSMVEHIGSTAVPGLAAKPVIDIAVGIQNLAQARAYIPLIESLGYIYEPTFEEKLPERLFFWKGTPTIHTYHFHMAELDHPVLTRPIRFRDYLRNHPDDALKYGELKKELAKICGQDMDAYVAGKTDFIEGIIRKAIEEG